jgi:MarR family transcriptional regulator, organic hydroperoxide resistance regulator
MLPTDESLLLDRQLCFALHAASLAMTKAYKPHLEALGLTYPQYLVMLVLWEADDLTVSEIGQRLQLDSGTLTPLLKRLDAAGLLSRERDPLDERRVRIVLSKAGRQLKRQAQDIPVCMLAATQLSRNEADRLRRRLNLLRQRLGLLDGGLAQGGR